MTKRELLSRMTSEELSEWQAFDMLEPIGSGRTNQIIATLAMLFANKDRDRSIRPDPWPIDAFIPSFERYRAPPADAVPGAPASSPAPAKRGAVSTALQGAKAAGSRLMQFLDRRL